MKLITSKKTLITLATIVMVGVLSRTIFHIAPNFELITGLTLLSATRLPKNVSWLAPLLMLLISDFIIGNTVIFVFTWSGFAFTYLWGRVNQNRTQNSGIVKRSLNYEVLAIVSVAVFFLWTNLGVVVTSSMYVHNWAGYMESLVMALPFLKIQLISVMLTTPIIVSAYEMLSGKLGFATDGLMRPIV